MRLPILVVLVCLAGDGFEGSPEPGSSDPARPAAIPTSGIPGPTTSTAPAMAGPQQGNAAPHSVPEPAGQEAIAENGSAGSGSFRAPGQIRPVFGVTVEGNNVSHVRQCRWTYGMRTPRGWALGPIDRLYVGCDGVMTCTNEVGEDGRLKWREVKVGCCFWYDASGHTHKRIFGRIEAAEDFGVTLRRWADQCGLASAKEVVFIGDGGEWIWNIANRHFHDKRTTWVLDWFHLVEHLWEAARTLHPDDRAEQVGLVAGWKRILRYDGGIRLWRRLQEMQVSTEQGTAGREAIESLLGYLKPRLDQTDYPTYRQRDMAIGSGAVESAGKQLVVQRAKGPGMHWTAEGLEVVLALRSISLNRDWDDFWKTDPQRAAA